MSEAERIRGEQIKRAVVETFGPNPLWTTWTEVDHAQQVFTVEGAGRKMRMRVTDEQVEHYGSYAEALWAQLSEGV